MPIDFDPYYKWFGIPPSEQPPNHYRLLGINLFEADDEVIQTAAERHKAFLQNYQTGSHAEWAQKLRGDVTEARRCLLHPANKAQYDENLRDQLAQLDSPVSPPLHVPVHPLTASNHSTIGPSLGSTPSRRRRRPSTWLSRAIPDDFDPYYKWLGIPPSEQPPNHYRLLGINLFEADDEVIKTAAERHMAHLQIYKIGPQAEWSQELLSEFAQARLCLLNRTNKAEYDQKLQDQRMPPSPVAPPADTDALSLPQAMTLPLVMPARRAATQTVAAPNWVSAPIYQQPVVNKTPRAPSRVHTTSSAVSRWRGKQSSWRKRLALVVFMLLGAMGGFAWWRMNHTPDQHHAAVPAADLSPTQRTLAAKGSSIVEIPEEPVKTTPTEVALSLVVIPLPVEPIVNVPLVAKAPFDAEQAKAHQEAWAKHLGVEVTTINSVGVKLILVPPGEFLMGSTDEPSEKDEQPPHRVLITKPFLIGATEVTVEQFNRFAASGYKTEAEQANERTTYRTPGYPVTDDSPAAVITWNDAVAYCKWLSSQEKVTYRLPTEAEWEYACRAGTTTKYSFGDDETLLDEYDWYSGNARIAYPVGKKPPNAFGLYDMHGNLYEWCRDFWDPSYYDKSPIKDPSGPVVGTYRVVRGGSATFGASNCRSAYRHSSTPSLSKHQSGFRIVRELEFVPAGSAVASTTPAAPAPIIPPPEEPVVTTPLIAKAPLNAAQATARQEAWAKHLGKDAETANGVGMTMILIPPGEFLMGSTDVDPNAWPQHPVRITRPFYMGRTEVTQGQWKQVMSTEPWKGPSQARVGSNYPASYVSWDDAIAFCIRLTGEERDAGRIAPTESYTLPTEAQWEYACRAGTTTRYSFGDDMSKFSDYGFSIQNARSHAWSVGSKRPNAFGLCDLHGNLCEWCQDWYDPKWYAQLLQVDPRGPSAGTDRVIRGGSWKGIPQLARSAYRSFSTPVMRIDALGFRVVRTLDAEPASVSLTTPGPALEPVGAAPGPASSPLIQRSEADVRSDLDAAEKAFAAQPADLDCLRKVAKLTTELADLQYYSPSGVDVERHFRRAVEVCEKLVNDDRKTVADRVALARILNRLGLYLRKLNRFADAETVYLRSIKLCTALHNEFPNEPQYESDLAGVQSNLAVAQSNSEKVGEAVALLESAIEHERQVLAVEPTMSQATRYMLTHYNVLAGIRIKQGQHALLAQAAEGLIRDLPKLESSWHLAANWQAQCVSLLEQDQALAFDDREPLRKRYTERAVEMLRKALSLGWRPGNLLEIDPKLAPIRSAPAFQELLQEFRATAPINAPAP